MTAAWEKRPLGEVCTIQNGYAFDSKKFTPESGTPLIRIRDLKGGYSTETNFDGEFDPRYVVKSGTFLIGMDGDFACHEWKGEPALLNQRVCRIELDESRIHPRFLFYGINKHLKAIEDVTGFSTVKHLSSKRILGIEFSFPPLEEQKHIVAILDAAFADINSALGNMDAIAGMRVELFDSFVRELLASRNGAWSTQTVGSLGTVQTGSTPRSADSGQYGNAIQFVKPAQFLPSGRVIDSDEGLSHIAMANARVVPSGSVLMVCIGATIGKCATTHKDVVTNQQINALTPSERHSARFIYYVMQTAEFQKRVRINAGQATLPIINKSKWMNLEISVPDTRAEQERIADRLDSFLAERQGLSKIALDRRAQTTNLRQSLLHRAFTGQL